MKALLFHKFRNIYIKTILWTRNTTVSLFLYIGTKQEKAIQTVSITLSRGRVNEG